MRLQRSLALWMVLVASMARAHDDATLDRMPSPHGGQVRMAGPFHFELVIEPERLVLHVMDHANQSVSAADGRATAKITTSAGTETIELLPIADSTLGAEATVEPLAGAELDITVSLPGQRAWSVTFTPSSVSPPANPDRPPGA